MLVLETPTDCATARADRRLSLPDLSRSRNTWQARRRRQM